MKAGKRFLKGCATTRCTWDGYGTLGWINGAMHSTRTVEIGMKRLFFRMGNGLGPRRMPSTSVRATYKMSDHNGGITNRCS